MLKQILNDIANNPFFHLYWKDLKGTYQGCNQTRANALGLSCTNDIIGKSDIDFMPKDIADHIYQNELAAIEANKLQITEEVFFSAGQQKYHHLVHRFPVFNDKGIAVGSWCLSFDITEKKQLDDIFKAEKEKLESTLDNILTHLPGHIYWKDLNSNILGCNDLQAKSAGFNNRNEMTGKTDFDMPWKEDALLLQKSDLEVINNKKTLTFEETSQTANSDQKSIFLSKKTPLYNINREVIGVLGISIDITERKQMEENLRHAQIIAEAANQAKTEFLSNMRHDIRTPLSGIIGFSDLIKSESNEAHIKDYADSLIASSYALLHFHDDVLEAIRVSSGEIPILKRKFNLSRLFEQVIALCKARAGEKQLQLNFELDSNLPNFAIGDKIRLHRIALELISNALNFTDDGHVTLKIELAKQKEQSLVIKMTVIDTGMGIPKNQQQNIYVQFKRLTPSYQGIYKGAGLGLFVVKQFIDELNGEIYVESEPHKGTCFTCLIPLQEPLLDDASGIDEETELQVDKPYLTPLTCKVQSTAKISEDNDILTKILVVEDNIIAQMAVKIMMASMACHVDVASNGEEALKCCQNKSYDLVFMDIGLGDGIDGYEVTRQIRSNQGDLRDMPIIALTAHGADENKQRCIEAGMNAVLTKPLTKLQAADILKTFVPARKPLPSLPEIKPARRDLPDTDLEMFQMDQFSLFDEDQGMKNSGSKAMLIELLTMMASDIPKDMEKMKIAFENKDFPQVEHQAHKIKGGAVYVGTTRLKYACQYLERYWKSGERKFFEELFHQAIKTIEETKDCISNWLHQNNKSD